MSLSLTPEELKTHLHLRPNVKVVIHRLTTRKPDTGWKLRLDRLMRKPIPHNQVHIEPLWDDYYAVSFSSKTGTIVAITSGISVQYHSFFIDSKESKLIPTAIDLGALSNLIFDLTTESEGTMTRPWFKVKAGPTDPRVSY